MQLDFIKTRGGAWRVEIVTYEYQGNYVPAKELRLKVPGEHSSILVAMAAVYHFIGDVYDTKLGPST